MAKPGNVTIDRDGYLTFQSQELQAAYGVFREHEPVTVDPEEMEKLLADTTGDPVERVLTLTLPAYISDRFPVEDRAHLLCYLWERTYSFRRAEDGSAYLRRESDHSQLAGVTGHYEMGGTVVSPDSGGVFLAEQCTYFRNSDSLGNDLYWDNLHVFINGAEPSEHPAETVEADAAEADRKASTLYESWSPGSEELIEGLLYSYLEQNGLTEFAWIDQDGGQDRRSIAPLGDAYGVSIDMDGTLTFLDPALQEVYNFIANQPAIASGDFHSGDGTCSRILSLTVPHTLVTQTYYCDYAILLMEEREYWFSEENGEKIVRAHRSYSGPVAVSTLALEGIQHFQVNGFWMPAGGFQNSDLSKADLDSLAKYVEMTPEEVTKLLEQAEVSELGKQKNLSTDLLFSYMSQNGLTGYSLWSEQAQDTIPVTEEKMKQARQRASLAGRIPQTWFSSPTPYRELAVTTEEKLALLDAAEKYVLQRAFALQAQSAFPVQEVHIDSLKITELADDLSAMRIEYSLCFKTDSPQETPCSLHEGCYKTSPGVCLEILQKADGKWKCFTEDTGALFDLDGDGERDPGAFLVDWDVSPSEIIQAARAAAQEFVDDCLNNPEYGLTESFFTYLELVAVSKDENSFVVRVYHDFKVGEGDPSITLMAGNTDLDTGKYEGYYKRSIELRVAKDEGKWSIKSIGTGGAVNYETDRIIHLVLLDDR